MKFGGYFRNLFLMAGDVIGIYGVWLFSLWFYRAIGLGTRLHDLAFYSRLWPIGLAFVVLNVIFRLYHGRVLSPAAPVSPIEEFRRLTLSSVLVHLGLIAVLVFAFQTTKEYSRAVICISGVLTGLAAQPVRDLARAFLRRLDVGQIPVVLLGEGELVARVRAALARDAYTGFAVLDEGSPAAGAAKVAVLCRDIRLLKFEMDELTRHYTHVEYVPSGDTFPLFGSQTATFDGLCAFEMVNQRKMRALQFEKWLLDKVLTLIVLAGLSPFFVVVPILIKLTSRGPVFYRQKRLGRDGRQIRVWKFRSMYADADERLTRILAEDPRRAKEWAASFKLRDDPRVTPLGRFLRKTSIDEFPQLLNVLAGDMALVGPRPIVEAEVGHYGSAYGIFSSVKPGITGLWQVSGRSDAGYARRVALDTQYVLNWSPWLDLWIMKKTVGAVLFMRGAC